jgi:citrate synthase
VTDERWPTSITDISPEGVVVRGHPVEELVGTRSFADTIWLLFTGELPSPAVSRIVDAILVLSIDHGPGSPSALTARTIVSGGVEPALAATAGLIAMGPLHGSPAGQCVVLLREIAAAGDREAAARAVVDRLRDEGARFPGFGHRQHRVGDLRVDRLLDLGREVGLSEYLPVAEAVRSALVEATGHALPMNLDGAIATVLAPTALPPEHAANLFMVSRFAGLNAQALEERERMRPMRVIEPRAWFYDGPSPDERGRG